MRELIGRLEVTNNDAASALRVIAHFDALVGTRASGAAMVRAAAALAGCNAAWHDGASSTTRRMDPLGRTLPATHIIDGWRRLALDSGGEGVVWLERGGPPGPFDDLILERLAKALDAAARPDTSTTPDHARCIRMACDVDLSTQERRSALRRLGLSGQVTVLATDRDTVAASPLQTAIDMVTVTLLPAGAPIPLLPKGLRAGSSAADVDDLPEAFRRAVAAMTLADAVFADQLPLRYEDAGPLADLAGHVTPQWASSVPDVAILQRLQDKHPWVASTVVTVVAHASLRQAAAELHLHHSTLQERMAWLESHMGYAPLKPTGRQRLSLATALWRIARSGAYHEPGS